MAFYSSLIQSVRTKKIYWLNALVILVIVGAIAAGKIRQRGTGDVAGEATQTPQVHVLNAVDYRKDRRVVLTSGVIESQAQVEIRAQANAPVARVYVGLGDRVAQGQTLLTLENSDLAAQLAQAQAGLQVQKVRLQEVKRGARSEERLIAEKGLEQAEQALLHLQQGIYELLTDAYVKTEDAVRTKTDALFTDDEMPTIQFSYLVTDAQAESDTKVLRQRMTRLLTEWEGDLAGLAPASRPEEMEEALRRAIPRLQEAGDFFAAVAKTLVTPSGVSTVAADAYRMNVNIGRTTVTGLTSALTGYERNIARQKVAVSQVHEQVNLTETGASAEQVAMQEAVVKQAEAAVQAVAAQYQKTIIRAPFAGTVARVPVKLGDLATFGTPLVSLVNTEGLKLHALVSEEDATSIEIGAEATVEEDIPAMVAERAPSIDPGTKKVEVIVVIPKAPASLLVGQSVALRILPKAKPSTGGIYLLPIQAVSISPQGAFVFTVGEGNMAHAVAVTLGTTAGEFVEVTKGIEDGMKLVSTVQDLKEGDLVELQQEQ